MVGLSAALGVAQSGLAVAVVDSGKEPSQVSGEPANRVSAISAASQLWLAKLGAWDKIITQRLTPYRNMEVWQSDRLGRLDVRAQELGVKELGHIVENDAISFALWQQAKQHSNIELYYGNPCKQLNLNEREAWLTLENGSMLGAQLMIGADGAHSWSRQQANLPMTYRDYGHHAIVATVKIEKAHEQCARQAFTKYGPLAFLPLHEPHLCSIVWSLPPEVAKAHMSLDSESFNRKLTAAFNSQLGLCEAQADRAVFPLTMRYVRQWAKHRLILMGDAAHTIHPLAGQGANLGFADAMAAVETIKALSQNSGQFDLGLLNHWRSYERARKSSAVEMLAAMEAIKQAFSPLPAPLKTLIGAGMNLVNQVTPLKKVLVKRAMGV